MLVTSLCYVKEENVQSAMTADRIGLLVQNGFIMVNAKLNFS